MGLVSPSASMMPVVTAVSVWPTCAVPVMVGTPVGAVLVVPSVPLMVMRNEVPKPVGPHTFELLLK